MEKITTVEEFLMREDLPIDFLSGDDVNFAMIEFAKLHVEAALKEASEKGKCSNGTSIVLKNSILNSYSLDNIK